MTYSEALPNQPIGMYSEEGEFIKIWDPLKDNVGLRLNPNYIKNSCDMFGGLVCDQQHNYRFIYIIDGFIPDRISPSLLPFNEKFAANNITKNEYFQSTKVFDGFSSCFRQWRAESHCNQLHNYPLYFKVWFEGPLDDKNWTIDFGSFKRNGIKEQLAYWFDHSTIVAIDDPELSWFIEAHNRKILDLRIVRNVGCEKYAELVYSIIDNIIQKETGGRCRVKQVEASEHDKNSAIYTRV